jgi:hypothetical protein
VVVSAPEGVSSTKAAFHDGTTRSSARYEMACCRMEFRSCRLSGDDSPRSINAMSSPWACNSSSAVMTGSSRDTTKTK